jgi:hypothetical protein
MLKSTSSIISASQIATPITLPGDVTLSTGNLVIGTSGKGIDFSATPGTGTSELLADYEEGTWTVTWTSLTSGTPSNTTGTYTKIGRTVNFNYAAGANVLVGVGDVTKFSLPFTPAVYAAGSMISQSNTNSGSLLVDPSVVVYPNSFSGGFMVFSGTYSV